MGIRLTLLQGLVGAVAMLVTGGCGPDYPDLKSSDVRAFTIPIGDPEARVDSTLCLLSVPAGYTPDRAFPLLVALHGGGSSAIRFHDLWRSVTQARGYVLATPQGEEPGPEGIGHGWGPSSPVSVRRSIDVVLRNVNVDRSRVYLSGFSQGGQLTYTLALSYPHAFAGIAPLGVGYDLPNSQAANALRRMRVYIGHGEMEPGLEDVRGFAEDLRDSGCEVRLATYDDIGHGISQPVTSELERILEFLGASE